jgi:ribose transport system substrate-binding protein
MQSQEVLKLLHSPAEIRPDAILFEPVGTALAQAAKIAVSKGVGWVVLNRQVDYLSELRRESSTPLFCVSTNHDEVGRIQGEQIVKLLPRRGGVLYIHGPSDHKASLRRAAAMEVAKSANVEMRVLKGLWTEESAFNAVRSWLKLNVVKDVAFGVVAAQNDVMALGARRAFQKLRRCGARSLVELAFHRLRRPAEHRASLCSPWTARRHGRYPRQRRPGHSGVGYRAKVSNHQNASSPAQVHSRR